MQLYTKILIGMVLGILVGALYNGIYDKDTWAKWDSNQDNQVSLAEYLTANELPGEKIRADFDKIDQENDGKITLREYQLDFFNKSDLNQDGKVVLEEYLDGVKDSAYWKALFEQDDANGNGYVSMSELVEAHFDHERWADMDKNDNGELSFGEFLAESKEENAAETGAAFASLDNNNDGNLSLTEFKAVYGWQRFAKYTDPIGDIFIRLVKMLVVPLVLVSLILGAASLGDIRKVGKIGLKAFGFFMATTAIAALIGIGVGNIIRPGDGLPPEKRDDLVAQYEASASAKTQTDDAAKMKKQDTFDKISALVVRLVPTNPFKALSEGDMLGVIFFSLFLGLTITMIPDEKALPIIKAFDGLNDAVIKMVTLAMETAPYGVFALMINVVAALGMDVLLILTKYAIAVLIGLLLHVSLTHGSLILFYLRKNPILFVRAVKESIVMAFSTSSSSAALPISLNVSQTNLGVSRQVSTFILPLGATINMDGTAVYQAIAALFIAQVYDIPLDFTQQMTIILTATLASVGAAGVPGAGMITLALVLSTLGVPEAGIALIFGLDRILDMCRTTVNVIGDLTLSAIMAKSEGEEINIRLDKDLIPG
ncbi:MAG: cation:dicarboxylase symporter family transporter [Bacteroidia bacterium]|nr:cation:dicarboxylase symporter family transporter [Bacteroidia bacterium]